MSELTEQAAEDAWLDFRSSLNLGEDLKDSPEMEQGFKNFFIAGLIRGWEMRDGDSD